MSQLFSPSNSELPEQDSDRDFAPPSMGMRALPAPPNAEQAFFQLDVKRSLDLHWRLARAVAIGFVGLAVLYFLAQVFVLKSWPAFTAESIVYVQPTPAKVLPSEGGAPRWPFDSNTYETYIQQQMMNVSRQDVLIGAIRKLNGFEHPGESDQFATQRLVRALEVTREGTAYQFSITARAGSPELAAQIANAVTAAYIESASRDERTGDQQRLTMLKEERDRIQTALVADRTEQEELNKQLGVASVGATVPDHFDEDITQIRTELAKARTDHDAAESKFASLDAGRGPSSAAIDAQADELIASDAGLVSMKQSLNSRRATLIAQMANLTPANPQYKLDEAELAKINSTLEAMMKDLRSKAAARIQLQLRADLQRTGGVESQLNGQLRQLVGAATGATPKMQRSSDLAGDITRLQARFANVDEELHNVLLEDNAPAAAYQVTPAVAPLTRAKSGVLRNTVMIALAGLFFGVLAAILAHKTDPRIYIAADVERVLGFAPLAQLPNFNEVSEGVGEEYMLRLASAIEHGRKQGNLKNCIFTGTGPGTGVSTLVNRVREMLEAMGRTTILVDATGIRPPSRNPGSDPSGQAGARGLMPGGRITRPTALLQRMAAETETEEDSLVLTDTAPLSVSAETEYLARFVDCAIVVIESGVTTRAALLEAAQTLQRLNVGAVGFVLNRVGLAKADPAFRASLEAVEKHLKAQGVNSSRRDERSNSSIPESPNARDSAPRPPSPRPFFEPEVAAAAAAVARFSAPPAPKPGSAQAVCLSSPMVATPIAEAAKRFSLPFSTDLPAQSEKPVTSPPIKEPAASEPAIAAPALAETIALAEKTDPVIPKAEADLPRVPAAPLRATVENEAHDATDHTPILATEPKPVAPFAEAAEHFAMTAAQGTDGRSSSHPVAAAPSISTTAHQDPGPPIAASLEEPASQIEPAPAIHPVQTLEVAQATELVRAVEPLQAVEPPQAIEPAPPVEQLAQVAEQPLSEPEPVVESEPVAEPIPAKQPKSAQQLEPTNQPEPIQAAANPANGLPWWLSDAPHNNPEPVRPPVLWQPAMVRNSNASLAPADLGNAPDSHPKALDEARKPDSDSAPLDRNSRLSGLRNLLFVLGVKNARSGEEPPEQHTNGVPKTDPRTDSKTASNSEFKTESRIERTIAQEAPRTSSGVSTRLVTAPPEVLPPRPLVIEFDNGDARVGESSRQDRRPAEDRVEILPSRRGQYKKT